MFYLAQCYELGQGNLKNDNVALNLYRKVFLHSFDEEEYRKLSELAKDGVNRISNRLASASDSGVVYFNINQTLGKISSKMDSVQSTLGDMSNTMDENPELSRKTSITADKTLLVAKETNTQVKNLSDYVKNRRWENVK